MPRKFDAKRQADPASPGFALENSPFFLMNRAAGTYALAMEHALRSVGADIPRWRVLMLATERGPISVSTIAELGVIRLSTTTKVVQRLARDGLLTLGRSRHDARVTQVRITPKGRRVAMVVRAKASEIFQRAFAGISAADITRLNSLLGRIQANITQGSRAHDR
jgi:MarR family transcriptional regulator, organic hydroperoxide resistance regulator